MFPAIPDQAEHRDQRREIRLHRQPPVPQKRPQGRCADRFLPERAGLCALPGGLPACPRAEADRRDGLSAGRETTSALCGENDLNGSMSGMSARWMVLLVHLRGASPGDVACLLIQPAPLDIG